MAKQNINSKKGFTIIEVVLVLAIAGLIFLMVFVALPALQRSQRDSQRRNDMSRVDTSLVQYQTNHSSSTNNLPATDSWTGEDTFGSSCTGNPACEFVRDYMNTGSGSTTNNEFSDPDGVPYSVAISTNIAASGKTLSDGAISPANWKSKLALNSAGTGLTIQDANGGNAFDQHAVYIVPGGKCTDDTVTMSTMRHFAIMYRLEGAGIYCIDDQ